MCEKEEGKERNSETRGSFNAFLSSLSSTAASPLSRLQSDTLYLFAEPGPNRSRYFLAQMEIRFFSLSLFCDQVISRLLCPPIAPRDSSEVDRSMIIKLLLGLRGGHLVPLFSLIPLPYISHSSSLHLQGRQRCTQTTQRCEMTLILLGIAQNRSSLSSTTNLTPWTALQLPTTMERSGTWRVRTR